MSVYTFLYPVFQHQADVLHHWRPFAEVRGWLWAQWHHSCDCGWGPWTDRREVCGKHTCTLHLDHTQESDSHMIPVSQWLPVAGAEGSDCKKDGSENNYDECNTECRALLTVLQKLPQHPHTRYYIPHNRITLSAPFKDVNFIIESITHFSFTLF